MTHRTPATSALLPTASNLARGVSRRLGDLGYGTVAEFSLRNGRRVDVIGLNSAGRFVIVEIKTTEADFRGDQKWHEYVDYCDAFYFAVPQGFPCEILPADHGLMVVDAYGAETLRVAPDVPINPSRRRAQILRFALAASTRLSRLIDPRL